MNQDMFSSLLQEQLIESINVDERLAEKGKPLSKSARVWIVRAQLSSGANLILRSTRGTTREWSSLDTLSGWLRLKGAKKFVISYENEAS